MRGDESISLGGDPAAPFQTSRDRARVPVGDAEPALVAARYEDQTASWIVAPVFPDSMEDDLGCGPAGYIQVELGAGVVVRVDRAEPGRLLEAEVHVGGRAAASDGLAVIESLFGASVR